MLALRVVMLLLCAVGFYASVFMLRKSRLESRGALKEPSVVQSPRAKVAGIPNSLMGCLYYPALAIVAIEARPHSALALAGAAAAAVAAAFSAYLAASLLFVTRRPCVYCWMSHAVNWLLLAGACGLSFATWV